MPDDTPPSPPRPPHLLLVDQDAIELRETLELLGTLVASMSDRLDGQATTLDKLIKTAAETRAAAFHAKDRMDKATVAKALAESMDRNIGPLANQLHALQRDIAADRAKTQGAFDDFLRSTSDVLEQRRRQIAGLKARNWIPFTALGGLVLVLAAAALAPWAMAQLSGELLCLVSGGFWFEGTHQCMF